MNFFTTMTIVTQFAVSLLTPIVLSLLLCWYLTDRTGIGLWVYIPGFIVGFGTAFMVAYKLYLQVLKKDKKENRQRTSFNRHI
ncbi:MAG: AtpZ/AtpI family protein [Lachnospiraceae bacterium]|nr:AtpZ/AtpI family protein [Lachnospiraceae bacterium]